MSTIFELLGDDPASIPVTQDDSLGQFGRGLRSGAYGAGAQLSGLAGGVAESVGADEFAQRRYSGMAELADQAQEAAPRVTSYKDVGGLRDAFDYTTGLIGQSLPVTGAAVAGGLATGGAGVVPAMLGAAAASAPFEVGDVIQRQQNDPVALEQSAGDRLGQAVLSGGASALAQGVVPAIVGGKVMGRGLRANPTVGNILARGADDVALEGATEGAGEVLKQGGVMLANPDRQLDTDAVLENVVGGAAAGSALGGAGVVGELAHKGAGAPARAVGAAKEAITGLDLGGKAKELGTSAKDTAESYDIGQTATRLRDTFEGAKEKSQAYLKRVADGIDVADVDAIKGFGGNLDKIKEALPKLDADRVERMKTAAADLMSDTGLTTEVRERIAAATQNLSDKASQSLIANTAIARSTLKDWGAKAKAFAEGVKTNAKSAGESLKKSEDFSGVRTAIRDELVPVLQRSNPALFDGSAESNAALNDVAEGVRRTLEAVRAGGKDALDSDTIAQLTDLLGDDTVDVLDAAYKAVGSVDPAERERFYGALLHTRETQARGRDLIEKMRTSLVDESLATGPQLAQVARELVKYAQGQTTSKMTPSEAKLNHERVLFQMEAYFGKKAGAILDAAEKEAKALAPKNQLDGDRVKTDEEGNALDLKDKETKMAEREAGQLQGDPVYYGPQKGGLAPHPDRDPAGDKGQAKQAMARAQKENPDRSVSFLSAKELGEDHPAVQAEIKARVLAHLEADPDMTVEQAQAKAKGEIADLGMVVAEGTKQETAITKNDLPKITVKGDAAKAKTSHLKNKGTLRTGDGGPVFDAVKLTKLMNERLKGEWTDADNKSGPHRTARMFMEGVAALQDHLGKSFDIPADTVISADGTTWGAVKDLDFTPSPVADSAGEVPTSAAQELRVKTMRNEAIALGKQIALVEEQMISRGENPNKSHYLNHLRDRQEALISAGEKAVSFHEKLLANEEAQRQSDTGGPTERDPFGGYSGAQEPEPINTDLAGNSTKKDTAPNNERLKPEELSALRAKFDAVAASDKASAGAKAAAARGLTVLDNADVLNKSAHRALFGLLAKGRTASDMASVVNGLAEKYGKQFKSTAAKTEAKPAPKAESMKFNVDKMVNSDDFDALDTKEKADAFMIAAAKRFVELKAEDSRVLNDDNHPTNELPAGQKEAFYALMELFDRGSTADLASYYPDFGIDGERTDDAVRAMIDKAVPEVAALRAPKEGPSAYRQTLKSAQGVNPNATGPRDIPGTLAYLARVLGNSVSVNPKANIPHAGEFERTLAGDIIRISVHALNPVSVAHHEALHAFFAKLKDQNNHEVWQTLEKAATSAPVLNQLRRLLANEPAALAQLKDAEEAAAYMYQFWAAGQMTVGTGTQSVFQRIAAAIKKALGIWTNDERALEIMDYFHSGKFASNLNRPSAVQAALVDAGRNQALESVKSFTKPLTGVVDALATAGGQRLRDTGVPALRELADAMKLASTMEGEDAGFLPAARRERARVMNKLSEDLAGYTKDEIQDALEAMQNGVPATGKAKQVQRIVQGNGGLLPSMLTYMGKAGVNLHGLKIDTSYFPRVWDTSFISRHQKEFLVMLEKYVLSGKMRGDPQAVLDKLIAADGAEFTVEVDKPGMQNLKERVLAFIDDADAAPFMRKDMFEILNSYVTQATRRGEWAKRFGDDGRKIGALVTRAKREGATDQDIQASWGYVKAVDGTLGDGSWLTPQMRRVMGNMIVYQNIRLLPMAIFSSVIDPLGIVVRGGTVRDAFSAFGRGMAEVKKNFQKEPSNDAATNLAETMGVIDSAALLHTIGASYSQGMVGDTGRKINDVFFRFNLMEQFNRSMRTAASQAALKFLDRHASGKATAHSERWMRELGFEPGEYTGDLTDPKVHAAVNRWVDGAVLRPDAADKPLWMSDPRYALISHLKQFAFSFQETILKRVTHEYRHGNYAPAMAITSYVPFMIASDLIKGMVQGGGETPEWKKGWTAADYVGYGVERAGLLGVGQFAVDLGQHGPLGALAGPTIEQLADGVRVASGVDPAGKFALKAMPANALYSGAVNAPTDVTTRVD